MRSGRPDALLAAHPPHRGMETAPAITSVPRLLSIEAAAAYLGVPVRTLQGLREQRLVPVVRLGRRLYFRPEDLDRLVESRLEPAMRGPLAPGRPRLVRRPA